MPFRRFMELALYCPEFGYYEKQPDIIGRQGDFYTSPATGKLFGQLLAFQFAEWIRERFPAGRVQIVEGGAHRGDLAHDILEYLETKAGDVFGRLEYVILEPSERRRGWQREKLGKFREQLRWANRPEELRNISPDSGVRGVIFGNELLDAFPVQRWVWDESQHQWFEMGVKSASSPLPSHPKEERESKPAQTAEVDLGRFEWSRLPDGERPHSALCERLPDGFVLDTCPTAVDWWRSAAKSLSDGFLLTMDYGLTKEELFVPHRTDGTLRAYRKHQVQSNVLADPGEQDLTAHVDFSAIQAAGEAEGLATSAFVSQERFLTRIAARFWSEQKPPSSAESRQFQTLVHPEHLGRAFKVLVQQRGRNDQPANTGSL